MLAAKAREQSRINRDSIDRKRFDDLWGQLTDRLYEAIERGHFQTEIETNATGSVLEEIVAKLKAGKFDVELTQIAGSLYTLIGDRPAATFKLWIGWADDECEAAKALPAAKPKTKAKRKSRARVIKGAEDLTSAPRA